MATNQKVAGSLYCSLVSLLGNPEIMTAQKRAKPLSTDAFHGLAKHLPHTWPPLGPILGRLDQLELRPHRSAGRRRAYRRRSRCHTRLSPSLALRCTRGSLATLWASLRTFGFLSTLAAPWRSLAKRLSSFFLPLLLLNKGFSSSFHLCFPLDKRKTKTVTPIA
jgi:hypothetical protein